MTPLLKTDFSDARVVPTDDPQWDKLVLPAGEIPIMYEAGTRVERGASILVDDLQFSVRNAAIQGDRDGYYKGRVQLNVELPDIESVTMRTRMFLDLEAYSNYPKANDWFTVIELWAGAANSTKPSRLSFNLKKEFGAGNRMYFSVTSSHRDLSGKWWTRWIRANTFYGPPIGEWFDVELYVRNDRLTLVMGGIIIFDLNKRIPTPFTMIQPCKLYTSGAVIDHMREAGQPARILWDSLEIST